MTDYECITPEEAWEEVQTSVGAPVFAVVFEHIDNGRFMIDPGVYDVDPRLRTETEISRLLSAAESEPILLFKRVERSDD
jgi:hypothetical protein